MMNETNVTTSILPFASVFGPVGYLALYGLTLAVICPVQLFLNALTMAAILTSPVFKTIQPQRIVLALVPAVGMLTATALGIRSVSGIVLISGLHGRGVGLCQFAAVVLHTALAMRNMMWATLTVVCSLWHQESKSTSINCYHCHFVADCSCNCHSICDTSLQL